MACTARLEVVSLEKGSIKLRGSCTGQCETGCQPKWSSDPAGTPNAKVVASVTTGATSEILIEATDNPVTNYEISFHCMCGDQPSRAETAKYSLTYVRPLWQDIVSFGVTVAIDKLLK